MVLKFKIKFFLRKDADKALKVADHLADGRRLLRSVRSTEFLNSHFDNDKRLLRNSFFNIQDHVLYTLP